MIIVSITEEKWFLLVPPQRCRPSVRCAQPVCNSQHCLNYISRQIKWMLSVLLSCCNNSVVLICT